MRVTRTPSVPKGQTLRKAWRSLGSPTPDKAAWSPPLMYQYGETVITPRERMSRARLRLTSTVLKKPPLDGPGRRPYIANIPIQLWQSFLLRTGEDHGTCSPRQAPCRPPRQRQRVGSGA